ncbi:uncharacterized protein TRAVEDRAFT_27618, partial [Trametes versicolor FP-101664 SS1]|uniref:uncharacterized protein n=1 Tax=Trametes versicolor (strain FP-101664) TaxID=717944 RepID=UPI000462166A
MPSNQHTSVFPLAFHSGRERRFRPQRKWRKRRPSSPADHGRIWVRAHIMPQRMQCPIFVHV